MHWTGWSNFEPHSYLRAWLDSLASGLRPDINLLGFIAKACILLHYSIFTLPAFLKHDDARKLRRYYYCVALFPRRQDAIIIACKFFTNWTFLQKTLIWHFFFFEVCIKFPACFENFFFFVVKGLSFFPMWDTAEEVFLRSGIKRKRFVSGVDTTEEVFLLCEIYHRTIQDVWQVFFCCILQSRNFFLCIPHRNSFSSVVSHSAKESSVVYPTRRMSTLLWAKLGNRSDKAMTWCDEALNASSLQYLCQR